jgi:hypothetical protein
VAEGEERPADFGSDRGDGGQQMSAARGLAHLVAVRGR